MFKGLRVFLLAGLALCLVLPVAHAAEDTQINTKWAEAEALLKSKKMKEANQSIIELDNLRLKAGYTELPQISRELLNLAEIFWASGDKENAKYIGRKALEFSSTSPSFLLQAADCLTTFGIKTHLQLFVDFLKAGAVRFDFTFPVLISIIYPFLWSLTIATIASAVILFALNIHELLYKVRKMLPKAGAAYTSPLLLGLILTMPALGGPIWTSIIYVLCIYLFLPKHRVYGAVASVTIILWAVLIPVRENMNSWLKKPGVSYLLSTSSGIFTPNDLDNLKLLSNARSTDAAAAFAYAKALKRSGDFIEAEKVLSPLRKERDIGTQIEGELGILKFFKNETDTANNVYKELEEKNPDNASVLLNYSKIRFELLDTEESRWLFERANEENHSLAEKLRLNEEQFGIKNIASVAEFYLPVSYLMKSALYPDPSTQNAADVLASKIFPYSSLKNLGFFGFGMFMIFLLINDKKQNRRSGKRVALYKAVPSLGRIICIIPSGSDLVAGNSLKGLILMTFLVLVTLPLLHWPSELSGILTKLTGLELYYVFGYCFLIAALSYIGFSSHEKEIQ